MRIRSVSLGILLISDMPASADSITSTYALTPASFDNANSNTIIQVDQFDPLLGTLDRVIVHMEMDIEVSITQTNTGLVDVFPLDFDLGPIYFASDLVTPPGPFQLQGDTLATFSSLPVFPPGSTITLTENLVDATALMIYFNPASIWLGTGTTPLLIDQDIQMIGDPDPLGNNFGTTDISIETFATLSIVQVFAPAEVVTPIPEPSSAWLMLVGLLMVPRKTPHNSVRVFRSSSSSRRGVV